MTHQTHFKIPMLPDVRDWLDRAAPRVQRSRGAHVIFLLRQEMEKEKASGASLQTTPDASQQ
ncbi:hypothetical protein NKW55_15670 [Gluconobacter kondonii]|uniref:Arc-like DNA binding domain-containing protein n=1 Tax=Gluconobacter kondonii TaxID=941463 RepID=A0ABQ5WX98_9PROT|nr:hypothetical protein [Gluconobacter kondonii]MCP1237978.1 hypothetical protein [Gluconobacter kondonii]GBR41250.1 hypothetical protein AA3266_2767 [Gluconobacter kondonii NBRC 3266]GLQ67550.1 hypothetical protein GCM10007870_31350 [Gluconobacter kondonii]